MSVLTYADESNEEPSGTTEEDELPEEFVNPLENEYFYSFNNILGNCGVFSYLNEETNETMSQVNAELIKKYIDVGDKNVYLKYKELFNKDKVGRNLIINALLNNVCNISVLEPNASYEDICNAIQNLNVNTTYNNAEATNVELTYHTEHTEDCYDIWCTYTVSEQKHTHTHNDGCYSGVSFGSDHPNDNYCPKCGHECWADANPGYPGHYTCYCSQGCKDLTCGQSEYTWVTVSYSNWQDRVPSNATIGNRIKKLRCTRDENTIDKKIIYF